MENYKTGEYEDRTGTGKSEDWNEDRVQRLSKGLEWMSPANAGRLQSVQNNFFVSLCLCG